MDRELKAIRLSLESIKKNYDDTIIVQMDSAGALRALTALEGILEKLKECDNCKHLRIRVANDEFGSDVEPCHSCKKLSCWELKN